jgi:hypothetical protein
MSTLETEQEPSANAVIIREGKLIVELTDGRALSVPLEWYPRLTHATDSERQNWRLLGAGYAIEWLDVDEHIGVEGLLAGRKSDESGASRAKWLATPTKAF